MFELNDKVLIKANNVYGTIVDFTPINGKQMYVVESDERGKRSDGYGGDFPLFDCSDNEIVKA